MVTPRVRRPAPDAHPRQGGEAHGASTAGAERPRSRVTSTGRTTRRRPFSTSARDVRDQGRSRDDARAPRRERGRELRGASLCFACRATSTTTSSSPFALLLNRAAAGCREADVLETRQSEALNNRTSFDHLARECPHGLAILLPPTGRSSVPRQADRTARRGAPVAGAVLALAGGTSGHTSPCAATSFSTGDLDRVNCYVCGRAGHLCCAPQDEAWRRRWRRPRRRDAAVSLDAACSVRLHHCAQGRRGAPL